MADKPPWRRHLNSNFSRGVISVDAHATLPPLAQTDGNTMREQFKDKRLFAVMGVISRHGPNAETNNDIALPVPARLNACYGAAKMAILTLVLTDAIPGVRLSGAQKHVQFPVCSLTDGIHAVGGIPCLNR